MNRTLRVVVAVVCVLVIAFSAITVCQHLGRSARADLTEGHLYTLSPGTLSVLARIGQPVRLKLYFSETTALKLPDSAVGPLYEYYVYLRNLLKEYERAAGGKLILEIIDPRPYSEQEEEAERNGIRAYRIRVSEEDEEGESFFFGLAVVSEYGLSRAIPYLDRDRQKVVEYDVTSLVDGVITRHKRRIGVLSPLALFAEEGLSEYMRQIRQMQGAEAGWHIIDELKDRYDVVAIDPNTDKIEDVDLLMLVHPKDLTEQTRFAIDQFVLEGKPVLAFVDPFCFGDPPPPRPPQMQMMPPPPHDRGSNPEKLLRSWGLTMADKTYVADEELGLPWAFPPDGRPGRFVTFLELEKDAISSASPITASLQKVRMLYAGSLRETGARGLTYVPLLQTTDKANVLADDPNAGPFEPQLPQRSPEEVYKKFTPGASKLTMGYMVSGTFASAFPDGIEPRREDEGRPDEDEFDEDEFDEDASGEAPATRSTTGPATRAATQPARRTGLKRSKGTSTVVVFADVDMIWNRVAYDTRYGYPEPIANNVQLVINAVDMLSGSKDLLQIRRQEGFARPFEKIDAIEREAREKDATEEKRIDEDIARFNTRLEQIAQSYTGDNVQQITESILKEREDLREKARQAEAQKRLIRRRRRERIEAVGRELRNWNMAAAPAAVLAVAVALAVYRGVRRRRFVRRVRGA